MRGFCGGKSGCTFEGDKGTLYVDRGVIESNPKEILKEPLPKDAQRVYHATDHRGNTSALTKTFSVANSDAGCRGSLASAEAPPPPPDLVRHGSSG